LLSGELSDISVGIFYLTAKQSIPMNEQEYQRSDHDRRSNKRVSPDTYYSVQFSVKDLAYIYQFKIRDVSNEGLCILVDENSEVLKYLKIGDIIEMKYYLSESLGTTEALKTEIRHVTKDADKRFKGHCQVGLRILE
jgi:hypothetical protein